MIGIIGLYSSRIGREGIKSGTFHHTQTEDTKSTTGRHTQTGDIKSGTVHLRVSDLMCCSDEDELYKYGCNTFNNCDKQ